MYNEIRQVNSDRQKEIFVEYLNYKLPDAFEPKKGRDSAGGYVSEYKIVYEKLFDFNAGNKFFFSQRLNKFNTENLPIVENRKSEYLFDHPYIKKDTTIFHLPSGFAAEKLPSNLELKNDFAIYKNEFVYNTSENIIRNHTELILKKSIIQPNEYKEMALFFQSVNHHQNQKIILKKE